MKYSENNIQEMFLDSLSQLRSLNLSGNDIREFSLVLNLSGSLQVLDLSRNQISKIENDITASRLQKIRDVKLDGNPLICDRCHMGPLLQRVRDVSFFFIILKFYIIKYNLFFFSIVEMENISNLSST